MLNKNIRFLILIMILSILFIPLTHATQFRLINFQGRLTDQQGNTLDGTYNIIFSIYSSATDTEPLWTEEHTDVSVSNGLVNILLGSITSLDIPTKITFDQKRYLGIRIECDNNPVTTEPEMLPRQMILPAIYAYNAGKLDGKDGSEYTTPVTDAGRVGVVDDLYEGNTMLEEKYLEKDVGGNINGSVNIAGNVGIGTTSSEAKLHFGSGRPTAYAIRIDRNDGVERHSFIGHDNEGFYIQTSNNSDTFGFRDSSGAQNFIINPNTGNVGIGISPGGYKLAVNGGIFLEGHQYYINGIKGLNSGGSSVHIPGNVGIGTTNPSQKLDVAGYAKGQLGLCIGNDCRNSWPSTSINYNDCVIITHTENGAGCSSNAWGTCPSNYVVVGVTTGLRYPGQCVAAKVKCCKIQ